MAKPSSPPKQGQVVLYCDTFKEGAIYTALIASDPSTTAPFLDLAVIDINQNPALVVHRGIRYSAEKKGGTWHHTE